MKCDPTVEHLRRIFDYDPDTGILSNTGARKGTKAGKPVGHLNDLGYVCMKLDGRQFKVHRLIWKWVTGEWPLGEVDHIDGVKDDNRWGQLRDVSRRTNKQNTRKAYACNKSGLLGAHWNKATQQWCSTIAVEPGRYKSLGTKFPTALAAHEAFVAAKRLLHAGCTI